MRKPTLRQLEAFKAFVEAGSVSRAADVLHVSQPAASKLLTHLETDVGMRLIDRTKGRMTVTEKGMRIYEEIDKILSGVDQIGQAIATIRNEQQSNLTIGISPGFPNSVLVETTKEVLKQRPDAKLSFVVRSSEFVFHALLSRKIDVGLIVQNYEHPLLTSRVYYSEPMVVVMPKGHRLSAKASIRAEDLAEVPLITFTEGSATRRMTDNAFEQASIEIRNSISATTAPQCCAMVAAGLGVCVISPIFARDSAHVLDSRPFEPSKSMPIFLTHFSAPRDTQLIEVLVCALNQALTPGSAGL